jgi:hypothetical protein
LQNSIWAQIRARCAGFVDGVNLYAFVQNSPLNRLDLFGLISECPFGQVQINVPIPIIPRLPGLNAFLAKGLIGGLEVGLSS